MAFVHLHNHSFFSVLDASTSIQDMVDAAVAQHMHALALTDHASVSYTHLTLPTTPYV